MFTMATKGIKIGMFLAMNILILSSSLPEPVTAQSRDSEDSQLMVVGDGSLKEVDPLECPIGQECQDKSKVEAHSDTTLTSKHDEPFSPGGLRDVTKEGNSGISNEDTQERAMEDAPISRQEPEAGAQPSPSTKGRSKVNKRLKRKNRRRKCKEGRRKRKLQRKMRKRGGKGKFGGKGVAKRPRGKKGKNNKRKMKCGMKGRRRKGRKDRKRKKNNRKGLGGKLNSGKRNDSSTATTISSTSVSSTSTVQEQYYLYRENKNIEVQSKDLDSHSSLVRQNTPEITRQRDASESIEKTVIDSNKGVVEGAEDSDASEPEFDVRQITALFNEVLHSDPSGNRVVNFDRYIKAYKRLASVFHFFGPIFAFAKSDLEDKINTLLRLRSSSVQGSNPNSYDTFKSMFEYEYSIGIAKPGGDATSGVRENAWIHRALKFIIAIIRTVADKTDTSPLHSRVKEFYSEILAPHHSWLVRMGVYAAIYSFPSRESLLEDMGVRNDAEGMRELTRLADSIQAVYDQIQVHYEKYASSK